MILTKESPMRNSKTPLRLAAVLASAALAVSACGGDDGGDTNGDGGGDDTAAEGGDDGGDTNGGSLTIGIKYDQPGLGLMEGDTPSGMGVDVGVAVAEGLGYSEGDITWQEAPTPQRETLLDTGQVDMIVTTYSITDERFQTVDFAGPYYVAGQDLLIRADDDSIQGPADLEGKLLCSVTGSTSAANVQEEYPDVQLQEYSTYSECLSGVVNGSLDALTTDDVILAGYAAQPEYEGQLQLTGNTFSEENFGVGLPKGNEQCEEINDILNGMWEDGTMEQIIADNLGDSYQ